MTIAEKLQTIAENEPKVYEAGKTDGYDQGHSDGHAEGYSDGYAKGESDGFESGKTEGHEAGYTEGRKTENDAFWDVITDSGQRVDWGYAFHRWSAEYIRPNRKIIPTTDIAGNQTFYACKKLKKIEAAYFDFSQKPRGTRNNLSFYYFAYDCEALEEVEDIGLPADFAYDCAFANCISLHTIAKIRSVKSTIFNSTFDFCYELVSIEFEGVIGQNITLRWSTKLSVASMKNIILHLEDYSGTDEAYTHKLTLTNALWATLEADSTAPDGKSWREYVNSLGWNY